MSLMTEAGGSLKPVPFQQLYAVRRVAQILNCSSRLVYRMVQQGKLEAYRIGKSGIRIPDRDPVSNIPERDSGILDRGRTIFPLERGHPFL